MQNKQKQNDPVVAMFPPRRKKHGANNLLYTLVDYVALLYIHDDDMVCNNNKTEKNDRPPLYLSSVASYQQCAISCEKHVSIRRYNFKKSSFLV